MQNKPAVKPIPVDTPVEESKMRRPASHVCTVVTRAQAAWNRMQTTCAWFASQRLFLQLPLYRWLSCSKYISPFSVKVSRLTFLIQYLHPVYLFFCFFKPSWTALMCSTFSALVAFLKIAGSGLESRLGSCCVQFVRYSTLWPMKLCPHHL